MPDAQGKRSHVRWATNLALYTLPAAGIPFFLGRPDLWGLKPPFAWILAIAIALCCRLFLNVYQTVRRLGGGKREGMARA